METDTNIAVFDLFGQIFYLGNRMQYIVDAELRKDGLTTKQFLMVAAIEKLFDRPPSLNEVADVLSTSHQNARQLVNQLERKGFIEVTRDEKDRRVLRLGLTEKNRQYWDSRAGVHAAFVLSLFDSLDEDEIVTFHGLFRKLLDRVDALYNETKNGE